MNFLKNIAATLLVAGAVAAAPVHASVLTVGYTQNPDTLIVVGAAAQSFVHDLTAKAGYVDGMKFSSATLYVRLTDASGNNPNNETPRLYVGTDFATATELLPAFGNITNGTANGTGGVDRTFTFNFGSAPLIDLNDDGKLTLFIMSQSGNNGSTGDFNFAESLLTATIDANATTNVPEPMSLALMGLGLVAVGAARRRSSK